MKKITILALVVTLSALVAPSLGFAATTAELQLQIVELQKVVNQLKAQVELKQKTQTLSTSAPLTTSIYSSPSSTPDIIVLSPNGGETWTVGNTYSINWTSYNYSSSTFYIYLDSGSGFQQIVSNLAPSGTYQWNITSSTPSGQFKIIICSDYSCSYQDSSDGYFNIISPLLLPDLTVRNLIINPISPTVSSTIIVSYDIVNIGNAAASRTPMSDLPYLDPMISPLPYLLAAYSESCVTITNCNPNLVASGETRSVRYEVIFQQSGSFTFVVYADSANRINESNELNNRALISFNVTSPVLNLPDLIMSGYNFNPNPGIINQPVSMMYFIKNMGSSSTSWPIDMSINYSPDGITTSGLTASSCGGDYQISPNESCYINVNAIYNTIGDKSMSVTADYTNKIVESNELNNNGIFSINITTGSIPTTTPSTTIDLKVNTLDGPITIMPGAIASLVWTSNNASSCIASNDVGDTNWSGNKTISGSQTVTPVSEDTTYTLSCSAFGGTSVSDSVKVMVASGTPSIIVISPNGGETIQLGKNYTVKWKSLNLPLNGSISIDLVRTNIIWSKNLVSNLPASNTAVAISIPADVVLGNDYRIGIIYKTNDFGFGIADYSDSPFAIVSANSSYAGLLKSASSSIYMWGTHTLDATDGKTYQVKAYNNSVLGKLKKYENKNVIINGYHAWYDISGGFLGLTAKSVALASISGVSSTEQMASTLELMQSILNDMLESLRN